MTKQNETIDIAAYERAAAYSPVNFAAKLTGRGADGYWLDEERYFFCVAEADAAGIVASRPKIANASDGTVTTVIAAEALATLISEHSGRQMDAASFAAAQYDMPDAGTLVVTLGLDAWHISLDGPTLTKAETLDPVMTLHSPDGKYAVFLKDHAVWIKDRAIGTARQLSPDGEPYHAYGVSPESGVSPISQRLYAMPVGLWSADSEWFVTHRIDERALPESGLVEHVPAGGKRPVPHTYKVSSAEADLPTAEYVAFHLPSGRMVSADRHVPVFVFSPIIGRQCWFANEHIYFLDWDRFSARIELVEMNLADGATRTVLSETADSGWIDVHPSIMGQPMIRILPASNELIWWSQSADYGHLYLHDLTSGALKHAITQGEWMVREIVHVDEEKRRVLFLASGFGDDDDLGCRRLCAINFDGSGFGTLIADGDLFTAPDPVSGVDQIKPFRPSYARKGTSADGTRVALQTGAVDRTTQTFLLDIPTGRRTEIARNNIDAIWTAPKPQPFEVLAADGVTRLFGAMFLPTGFDPAKSYPVIDYIYPGPQMNWFSRRFPSMMGLTAQSAAELGAVAIILETRGMPNRSRSFHQAGKGHMLEPQLSDHAAAIEQLCQRHAYLDRDRVGIFGMSGGGHAAARAMFDYPEMFKVGVSVCGNHDCRNYASLWIDKYGGRPGTPERDEQSNVQAAHKLQGKLFLMHGDMDENVHPAHTLAVSAALIEAGKDFDQLILPGINHGVLIESAYAVQRLWNYFARNLIGAEPPAGFTLRWTPAEAGAAMGIMMEIL